MAQGGQLIAVGLHEGKTDAKQQGLATINIHIRNAYELFGLRRPIGNQFGKV